MSDLQASIAAFMVAELGSRSEPGPPWIWKPPPWPLPAGTGSGKSARPCERMHAA